MREISRIEISFVDLVVLVCAVVMLIAFFFMPWLQVSGEESVLSFSAIRLVKANPPEVQAVVQQDPFFLFVIPAASIGGLALTLWGMLNKRVRWGAAIGTLFLGIVVLFYYGIFLLQHRQNDVTDFTRVGFWVVFAAAIGLILQIVIPRPKTVARPDWRELRHEMWKNRWAYAFISPFYILFLIFGLFPVAFSIYLSFQDWNGVKPMEYVGFKNFEHIFGPGGKAFWQSIENGVYLFIMYVPIMTFMAIVLAVILNSERVRGFRYYRLLIFAPYVTSMIAAGFTFRLMLTNDGGLFNLGLESIGLSGIPWLEDKWWARVSLCMLVIWGWLGYNMVLMLAGLQTIPKELSEAARVDGATHVQTLFRIIIPLLRPMILFSVVLSTMGTFGLFNEVMALTNGGGPRRATLTPVVQIYGQAFNDFRFGRASAYAYVYFVLIFVLTIFQFRYVGREER